MLDISLNAAAFLGLGETLVGVDVLFASTQHFLADPITGIFDASLTPRYTQNRG